MTYTRAAYTRSGVDGGTGHGLANCDEVGGPSAAPVGLEACGATAGPPIPDAAHFTRAISYTTLSPCCCVTNQRAFSGLGGFPCMPWTESSPSDTCRPVGSLSPSFGN